MPKSKTLASLAKKFQVLDLADELPSGKYKGTTVFCVLTENPSYLVWFHNNTKYKLKERIFETAQRLITDDRPKKSPFDATFEDLSDEERRAILKLYHGT